VRVRKAAEAEPAPVNISVTLPVGVEEECDETLLSVVGARRAVLGESLVLEAHAAPSESTDAEQDAAVEEVPAVLWACPANELTVLGPSTLKVTCTEPGMHTVTVKLAPPAPCPTAVDFGIECIEAGSSAADR
jgi:hypothetical protein